METPWVVCASIGNLNWKAVRFFFSFLHVKRLPAWEVFLVSGFLSISDYHRALYTSGVMLGQLARPGEPGVPADLLGELFMHLLRA